MKTLKISICGDTGVGKTAIRKRWCENYFDTDCRMSLGVDIGIGKVLIDETAIKLQVWDVSGQTRFKEVRKGYYEGCWGGVLVFDIIHPASSFHMGSWIQELWQNSGLGQIPVVIVGNKQDLLYNHAQRISRQYGIALSQYISKITIGKGFKCEYIEVSAKTGHSSLNS